MSTHILAAIHRRRNTSCLPHLHITRPQPHMNSLFRNPLISFMSRARNRNIPSPDNNTVYDLRRHRRKNISCLSRLDHDRMAGMLLHEANRCLAPPANGNGNGNGSAKGGSCQRLGPADVRGVCVWGNHSNSQVRVLYEMATEKRIGFNCDWLLFSWWERSMCMVLICRFGAIRQMAHRRKRSTAVLKSTRCITCTTFFLRLLFLLPVARTGFSHRTVSAYLTEGLRSAASQARPSCGACLHFFRGNAWHHPLASPRVCRQSNAFRC